MSQPDQRPYTARPVTSTPAAPRLSGDPNYTGRHRNAGWVDTSTMSADDLAQARREQEAASAGLSSYVVSHLRTLVPLIWGAGLTWLADRYIPGLPPGLSTDPTVLTVITSGTTFLWYALWRWAEPRVPRALIALLLGHPAEPSYPD